MADEKTIKKRLSIRGLLGRAKGKLGLFTEADRLNVREDELSSYANRDIWKDKKEDKVWAKYSKKGGKRNKTELLKRLDKLTSGSRATDKDIEELVALINKGIAKRHRKK